MANGIITSPVSIKAVRDTLGESTFSLGRLCMSPRINKWAKYKPVQDPRLFVMHDYAHGKPISSGIDMSFAAERDPRDMANDFDRYEYRQPKGGEYEPFRISDFIGYYSGAITPVIVSPIKNIEMNSTGERVKINLTDQLTDYNISYDDIIADIPHFDPLEWRLAVAMCRLDVINDNEFASPFHFWVSTNKWSEKSESLDSYEVIVNANLMTEITDGQSVGLVAFLLKTGADWNYDVNGYDQSAFPTGTSVTDYKAIALPVSVGEDHFVAKVIKNQTYADMHMLNLSFNANRLEYAQPVPSSLMEKYNLYEITDTSMSFRIFNVGTKYQELSNTYIKVTIALYGFYDITSDRTPDPFPLYKGDSQEIVIGEAKLGDFDLHDTTEEVGVSIDIDKMYMFLDYTSGDYPSRYELRVKAYQKYFPGTEVLLRSEEFEYEHDGTLPTIGFNKEYEQ